MNAGYVTLGVSTSGTLLTIVGLWGLIATAGVAWTGVFGTVTACGIATITLGVALYAWDLVDDEPILTDHATPSVFSSPEDDPTA